jgi:hypothetical protein
MSAEGTRSVRALMIEDLTMEISANTTTRYDFSQTIWWYSIIIIIGWIIGTISVEIFK